MYFGWQDKVSHQCNNFTFDKPYKLFASSLGVLIVVFSRVCAHTHVWHCLSLQIGMIAIFCLFDDTLL